MKTPRYEDMDYKESYSTRFITFLFKKERNNLIAYSFITGMITMLLLLYYVGLLNI